MLVLALLRRVRACILLILLTLPIVAAIVVLTEYDVDFQDQAITSRTSSYGLARATILIDGRESAIGDASVAPETFTTRANLYAELARTEGVQRRAAALAGVPPGSFLVVARTPTRGSESADSVLLDSVPAGSGPSVLVRGTGGGAPLLQLEGRAPDELLAARLVNAVSRALRDFVYEFQSSQAIPPEDQIRLRQLGPPTTRTANQGPSRPSIAAKILAFWLVVTACILGVDYLRRQARLERSPTRSISSGVD